MLGFPLGILSAAGAGGVAGIPAYELISTTLLASTTASVTFNTSTLGTDYKHLQIRYVARSNRGVAFFDRIAMRINGDSNTANYKSHQLVGNTVAATSEVIAISSGGVGSGDSSSNNSVANAFSANVVDVLDFASTTKNTTVRTLTASPIASGTDQEVALFSGLFISTAAVTELRLQPNSGSSFVSGSRFSIYGIKG